MAEQPISKRIDTLRQNAEQCANGAARAGGLAVFGVLLDAYELAGPDGTLWIGIGVAAGALGTIGCIYDALRSAQASHEATALEAIRTQQVLAQSPELLSSATEPSAQETSSVTGLNSVELDGPGAPA